MELPVTLPMEAFYADKYNYPRLLAEMNKIKCTGFIRITQGTEEGYILFNEGKAVGASYENYSKNDALTHIQKALDNKENIIEVFEVDDDHIDYILENNEKYLFKPIDKNKESSETQDLKIPEEPKKPKEPVNRSSVMQKYGLKDIQTDEVSKVLNSFQADGLNPLKKETIEMKLNEKIKKKLDDLKEIDNAEVAIFLEESKKSIKGKAIILLEYDPSAINSTDYDFDNLKVKTKDILTKELHNELEEYDVNMDNFDINIEII